MTDPKINLTDLRNWYSNDGPEVERIWSWEILALIDTAEAATLLDASFVIDGQGNAITDASFADRLRETLDRFGVPSA